MVDATRALLDQLMGKHRNLAADEKPKNRLKWSDPAVCQHFMVAGWCPHELFTNTKSDLGPCNKEHDALLQMGFQAEPPRVQAAQEAKFLNFLEDLASEVDRKISRGNTRLTLTPQGPDLPEAERKARDEKVGQLNEQIKALLVQAEELGNEGKVDESIAIMKLVDGLRKEKTEAEGLAKAPEKPEGVNDIEKRMKVCETCGAFLVVGDAEVRVIAHLQGKQHVGFVKIRQAIAQLKEKRAAARGGSGSAAVEVPVEPARPLTIAEEMAAKVAAEKANASRRDGRDDRDRRSGGSSSSSSSRRDRSRSRERRDDRRSSHSSSSSSSRRRSRSRSRDRRDRSRDRDSRSSRDTSSRSSRTDRDRSDRRRRSRSRS